MSLFVFFVAMTSTILIPAGIGIVGYRSFAAKVMPFIWLIIFGLCNEIVMGTMSYLKIKNLYTLHFYSVVELFLLTLFFYYNTLNNQVRKGMLVTMTTTVLFSLVYAFLNENLNQFNSIPRAVESLLIISFGLFYFYEQATTGDGSSPLKDGKFFIVGGITFYFMSSFILFTFMKYVSDDYLLQMYIAHSMINAFCNLVYAFGLWKITSQLSLSAR